MELALFVYLAGVIGNIGELFAFLTPIATVLLGVYATAYASQYGPESRQLDK